MPTRPLYLLDTNVLLHLIRGGRLGANINRQFGLQTHRYQPLISIVSHGEIWVIAQRNNWGKEKRAALQTMLNNVVTIDIGQPGIVEAYVEVELASQAAKGGKRNMQDNDIWVAATAKATDSVLLTTDKDFDHLDPSVIRREWIDPHRNK